MIPFVYIYKCFDILFLVTMLMAALGGFCFSIIGDAQSVICFLIVDIISFLGLVAVEFIERMMRR